MPTPEADDTYRDIVVDPDNLLKRDLSMMRTDAPLCGVAAGVGGLIVSRQARIRRGREQAAADAAQRRKHAKSTCCRAAIKAE